MLRKLSAVQRIPDDAPPVHLFDGSCQTKEETMAQRLSRYGGKWKKWLAIYAAVGVVAYLVIFLLFFHHTGAGGGGFGY